MTDAVISGQAGVALLLEDGALSSFDVNEPGKLVPRQPADLHYLFGEARDLEIIEKADSETVARELTRAYNFSCALELALICLDSELSDETRTEAADVLEELLSDTRTSDYLESAFYAHPLPASADTAGALRCCEAVRAKSLHAFFSVLDKSQPAIRDVHRAWELIPTKTFGSKEERTAFHQTAIREELFYELVLVCMGEEKADDFLLYSLLNPSVQTKRNYRDVLQQWVATFRAPHPRTPSLPKGDDTYEATFLQRKGRKPRRRSFNRAAVLEKVESTKQVIVKALYNHKLDRARKLIDQLVSYQLENGEPRFAAMSLCDLAIEAKQLELYPLQLELTEISVELSPTDSWAWTQYGDALLNMNRLHEALKAYEEAEAFGEDVVVRNGRAEVLKALGRLDEALIVYNDTISLYPEDVVAKTGRAEVLKSLGRLDEALAAYDTAIIAHPENAVAKSGRAEVLKSLGRLDEALAAYDATISAHPEDVVAKCGRAEILKAMGRLGKALEAYNSILGVNPRDSIVMYGRSYVLLELRRYDEALEHLPKDNPVTRNDWIGYHIRGMVLLRQKRLDEAIRIFEHGVENDPLPSSKEYFRSALAVAMLRKRDFKGASRILEGVSAPLLQPQANVLRLHSYGGDGEIELASEAYGKLESKPWSIPDDLVDELHRRYILKEEPQHDDDWVFDKEIGMNLLVVNQQLMLSSYA